MAFIGTIVAIEDKTVEHKKCNLIEILNIQKETCFVEFRNILKDISDHYKIGTVLKVDYVHHGKRSQVGKTYNNLIATSVEILKD